MRDSGIEPLPLERLRADEPTFSPRRARLSGASILAHIGLCLAALCLWIFLAAFFMPPAIDRMVAFQKFSAAFGAVSMVTLSILCLAVLLKARWARRGMVTWAAVMLVWESIKLLFYLLVYPGVYRARTAEIIAQAAAGSADPSTQPSQFAGFISYGLYVIPIVIFLIFGGYAFAVW
ncbi:MAG: hypothetical protein NZ561_12220, partial [Phycisphaerae bacterium]|nr:hypothetical protein [Phycisphaerae bacterium]